jgi:hypothetical protein
LVSGSDFSPPIDAVSFRHPSAAELSNIGVILANPSTGDPVLLDVI